MGMLYWFAALPAYVLTVCGIIDLTMEVLSQWDLHTLVFFGVSVISFSYNIVAISSIQRLQWLSISGTDKSRAQSRRHVLIPSAVFAFIFARLGAGVAAYYDDERTTTGALTIAFDMVAVFVYCVLAVAVVNVWDIYQYMLEICSNKASNQHQLGLKAPPRKSSQGAPE